MHKKGSHGDEVKHIQGLLKQLGFDLEVDGHFGDVTHHAITTMQVIFGYDVDGIAGPATLKLLEAQAGYGWNRVAAQKAFAQGQA